MSGVEDDTPVDEKQEMASRLVEDAHDAVDEVFGPEEAEEIHDLLDAAQAAGRLEAEADLGEVKETLEKHGETHTASALDRAEMKQRITNIEKRELSEMGRERREEMALRMALSKAEENGGKWRMTTTTVASELQVSQRSAQKYLKSVAGRNNGVYYRQLGGKYQGVNQKGLEVSLGEYDGEFADEFSVE